MMMDCHGNPRQFAWQFIITFEMNRQNLNLSTSPQKDFKELINSIESKLELIASQNFEISQKQPFARSMPVPPREHYSPNKSYLQLEDLTTPSPSPSPSPVMERLDQIQQQYLTQISSLNHKLSMIQTENQELKQENGRLHGTVARLERELEIIEESNVKILEGRMEDIQKNLMHKLRQEIQEEISNYIVELEQMRRQIANERKNNKQLQAQRELLNNQRNNYEFLYREILEKYKQILQIDIDSYEKDSKVKPVSKSHHQNRMQINNALQMKRIKECRQPKKHRSKNSKTQELSKQELIPFLTKGIEELKQKLKLK